MSILVVDDDTAFLEPAAQLLEANGYVVWPAQDGAPALAVVKPAPPDAIVTDLMLPRVDGITLCLQLKTNPATSGIVIIVLSISPSLARQMRGSPADAILTKPFEPDDLVRLVNQQLNALSSVDI